MAKYWGLSVEVPPSAIDAREQFASSLSSLLKEDVLVIEAAMPKLKPDTPTVWAIFKIPPGKLEDTIRFLAGSGFIVQAGLAEDEVPDGPAEAKRYWDEAIGALNMLKNVLDAVQPSIDIVLKYKRENPLLYHLVTKLAEQKEEEEKRG